MKMLYPCSIKKEGDRYTAQFSDFDEAFTEGETKEEALFNASEVLSLVIEQRIEDNEIIPMPSPGKNKTLIAPEASVQSAALLYMLKTETVMSIADLARTLETSWPSVQRLFKPKHSPTLKQIEKAANAMGKRLILTIE